MGTARQIPELLNYALGERVGAGLHSEVYRAHQLDPGLDCAVKLIDLTALAPDSRASLCHEAAELARLSHENIVRVHARGIAGDLFYLAMDYVGGGDLSARIEAGMGWGDALSVARSVADGPCLCP